jgi:hypothetical protein
MTATDDDGFAWALTDRLRAHCFGCKSLDVRRFTELPPPAPPPDESDLGYRWLKGRRNAVVTSSAADAALTWTAGHTGDRWSW